jgi:hypothetical protein
MKNHPYPHSTFGGYAVTAKTALALVLILTLGNPVMAQSAPAPTPAPAPLSNLTLDNFFTQGWSDAYAKRSDPNGAPDMALLRVQTNFLEREFRVDFASQQNVNSTKFRTIDSADALIAYGLDRRFMLSVTSNYQWDNSRVNNDTDSSSVALGGRLQLIDVPGSSYALNLKVTSPAKEIANDLTTVTYSLAGWQDLTPYGLSRVGLYFDILGDNYVGPRPIGTTATDTAYDISLAKTWTPPDAALQNFTTFAELFGQTNLDGTFSGKTAITLTPGIRTGIGLNQVLMVGVDLPLSHPHANDWALRITYIINF